MTDLLFHASTDVRASIDLTRDEVISAAITAYRGAAVHDVTLEVVLEQGGFERATVRALFPDWNALLTAVIETWTTEQLGPIQPVAAEHGAVAFVRAAVIANIADPARVRLMAAMVPIAATPGHPMTALLQQQWLRFHAIVQRTLMRDVEQGREPRTIDCAFAAEQLIAIYEGLQIQAMVRPGMRLLPSFDRAVTRLQDGWRQTYTPPVWQI